MRLIIFASLLSLAYSQYSEDSNLRLLCAHYNGQYTERTAETGELCTDLTIATHTSSQEEAKELCQLAAPWRQRGAKPGKSTKCTVEATVTCASGWMQMFGWCYQLPRNHKRFTSDKADGVCKTARNDAQIATIRHRYHVGVFKQFFQRISQVWIQASEAFDKYVDVKKDGGSLALAFNGMAYGFSARANSLVRVEGANRLQVLCEYKPPSTPAEARYLGERYGEIYWPGVKVENGILIRSGSFYARGKSHQEICKGVMKPFGVTEYEPVIPDERVMERFKEQNLRKERSTVLFTRAAAEVLKPPQDSTLCDSVGDPFLIKTSKAGNIPAKFGSAEPKPVCDNMLSSAVVHRTSGPMLRVMSDSQSAPVWCKMGKVRKFEYKDEPGYTRFNRSNGEVVAHKLFRGEHRYDPASEICQAEGGQLSGFDSFEEYQLLVSLFGRTDPPEFAFLGASRRPECRDNGGFSTDPHNTCARGRVIGWENHAAHAPIDDRTWATNDLSQSGNHGVAINPDNSAGYYQNCLYLHNTPADYHDPKSPGLLDDRWCGHSVGFFCQKTLKIVEVD